jgi:hypothetical protein
MWQSYGIRRWSSMMSGEVAHGVWRLGVGRSCVEKMKTTSHTRTRLARWLIDTKTVSSLVRCGLRNWASAHGRFFIFFCLFSLHLFYFYFNFPFEFESVLWTFDYVTT